MVVLWVSRRRFLVALAAEFVFSLWAKCTVAVAEVGRFFLAAEAQTRHESHCTGVAAAVPFRCPGFWVLASLLSRSPCSLGKVEAEEVVYRCLFLAVAAVEAS